MTLRIPAVFVLVLQLQQFSLPALCMPMDRTAATCHDTHALPATAVITAAPAPVPCAQAGMCGAPATGLPALRFPVVGCSNVHPLDAVAVATPVPADPSAPLAPPPQA